jgi:hypothetical protein
VQLVLLEPQGRQELPGQPVRLELRQFYLPGTLFLRVVFQVRRHRA